MKTQNLEDLYKENPLQACKLALRRTVKVDKKERLEKIDKLLQTFGVEVIRAENEWDRYYGDAIAEYCNTGDTYALTVMHDLRDNKFFISSWGDWVERNKRKFQIK